MHRAAVEQALLSKDLSAKIRAVELALARGANILDAVMTRKHERETELDSRCRDMYIQHHEASAKMYRHLFQVGIRARDDEEGAREDDARSMRREAPGHEAPGQGHEALEHKGTRH